MKPFLSLLIVLTGTAAAGGIYSAECDDCNYSAEDLWAGGGLEDPLFYCAVYYAVDWGKVVSVEFDLAPAFGRVIGMDLAPIRHNTRLWDVIAEHQAEYDAFRASWVLPEKISGDDFPTEEFYIRDSDSTGLGDRRPPDLVLISGLNDTDKQFYCPRCGHFSLHFIATGCWD